MNPLRKLRTIPKPNSVVIVQARYGTPINRWRWHYANDDGVFEEDFNYIEMKKIPIPFPQDHFIYSRKGVPSLNFPKHLNDVRYNFRPEMWPRRHFVPNLRFKQYNFQDFDEMMHSIQWADFELDMQMADPIESNHYYHNRSPMFIVVMFAAFMIYYVFWTFYGSHVIDFIENPYVLRKSYHPAHAQFVFKYINSFKGHNYDKPHDIRESRELNMFRTDPQGNVLPTHIRRYPFADEYTFRI